MSETKSKSPYLNFLDRDGDGKVDIHDFLSLFSSNPKAISAVPALTDRASEAWGRRAKDLDRLSASIREKVNSNRSLAQKSTFSMADRRINALLNRLQIDFNDKNLEAVRIGYIDCLAKIKSTEEDISDLIAGSSHAVGKEKNRLEQRLKKVKLLHTSLQDERRRLLSDFVAHFEIYNVVISTDQAEVLLSRIDSGDVTKMTTVFAIISQLTIQFSEAKQASGEKTSTAQKYYAMYIGLLELQEFIQTEYIERMDKNYLPGISRIKQHAELLIAETQALMKSMPEEHLRSYENNLQSQEFTVEVASIYETALLEDRARALQAREIVRSLLKLAENTLKTVKVAADLVSLMKDSKGLYDEVMQLQTPSLVPFENLELKKEFQAVTERLQLAR
ncbi:hypothetical protein [Litorimonas sp.]|uniref:hypothetical protein n=1 Tax=Litorimonas sp. TaxID=1892381 RepID=UPI003A8B7E52